MSGDATPSCLALQRERDAWLFDVGEDTQRLLMWLEHIRPSKVGWSGRAMERGAWCVTHNCVVVDACSASI